MEEHGQRLQMENNIKETWKHINNLIRKKNSKENIKKLIIDTVEITNEQEIATHFNDYFSNIANSLNDHIPHSSTKPDDTINTNFLNSFYCRPTEINEIINIILNLKKSRSNINVLPLSIMQKVVGILAVPLSLLINYSFSLGKFLLN